MSRARHRGRSRPHKRAAASLATVQPLTLDAPGLVARDARGGELLLTAGVPGERVRAVGDARPSAGDGPPRGRTVAVCDAAAERVVAPCPLLDRCGGCALQQLSYPGQLAAKTAALRQLLAPLAPTEPIATVRGVEPPFGFRTRLLMPAVARGRHLLLGFYRRGSLDLVPATGCPVQHPTTLAVAAMARAVLEEGLEDRDWLLALGVRTDPPTAATELTVVGRTPQLPAARDTAAQLAALPGVTSLQLNVSPRRSSYAMGPQFIHLAGAERTPFTLDELSLELSPGSFAQTAHHGAALLVDEVRRALPASSAVLADLYGGAGLLTLACGDRFRRALLVEHNPAAVADLRRHLARAESAPAVEPVAGRVEERLDELRAARPDAVLLDPPRRGCRPLVIEALCELRPQTIVYVACGAPPLLEAGQRLARAGYRLQRATAVDMFPHTTHLEIVALFTRASGGSAGR